MPLPRSNFAARLHEFADFAWSDDAAFERRGRWGGFFRRRIGPAFDGRVIVEIGCADAGFLLKIAEKYPASAFIGVDWKCKPLFDGAQRIAAMELGNVALLRARGQEISRLFADGEVDEVWVFHPEPFDGTGELKNRLIAEPFLVDAHRVLRGNTSVLALKTDHPGYYQWVLDLFDPPKATPAIRRCFEITMNSADYWRDPAALAHTAGRCFAGERTSFENRFIKRRMPIHYVELRASL